jgi:hypothetical protein
MIRPITLASLAFLAASLFTPSASHAQMETRTEPSTTPPPSTLGVIGGISLRAGQGLNAQRGFGFGLVYEKASGHSSGDVEIGYQEDGGDGGNATSLRLHKKFLVDAGEGPTPYLIGGLSVFRFSTGTGPFGAVGLDLGAGFRGPVARDRSIAIEVLYEPIGMGASDQSRFLVRLSLLSSVRTPH